jgi:hypothetical protein
LSVLVKPKPTRLMCLMMRLVPSVRPLVARAVRWQAEHGVLVSGGRTVVFR